MDPCCACPEPIWWTARRSLISSRIFPTPTATRTLWTPLSAKPLTVVFPPELEALIPEEKRLGLRQTLACGPIPGYQHDPNRRYGFNFCGRDVRFTIDGDTLTVVEIVML